ncbi:MAG: hypothetical protein WBZ07_10520 [Candidatus Dormiibacterota bacterium]
MARPGLIPLAVVTSAAILLTGVVSLQLFFLEPVLPPLALGAGALAVIIVALAIAFRLPRIVTAAEAALLLVYILVLVGRSESSPSSAAAPIIAGGLVLSAQASWWAIDLRTTVHEAPSELWRSAAQIGVGALLAAGLAELIWQSSRIHPGRGIAYVVIGLVALIAVVLLFVRVSARSAETPPSGESGILLQHSWPIGPSGSAASRGDVQTGPRGLRAPTPRTWIAGALLVIDAVVTWIAVWRFGGHLSDTGGTLSFANTINVAPAIAFGVIGAGAVALYWLTTYLSASEPSQREAYGRDPTETSQPTTLSELDAIRTACQRARSSGGADPELHRMLKEISGRILPNSMVETPGLSIAQLQSRITELERYVDG